MSANDVQVAMIAAMPGFLATIAALIAAVNAHFARVHAQEAQRQIVQLEVNVNHRLTELVASTETAASALGRAAGVAEERARQGAQTSARAEGALQERQEISATRGGKIKND